MVVVDACGFGNLFSRSLIVDDFFCAIIVVIKIKVVFDWAHSIGF